MVVRDQQQLVTLVLELLDQPEKREAMGQAGFQMVENGKGALKRTLVEIHELLEQRGPD